MVNVATMLVGPLVGPECRRAAARGWIILVRSLAALALGIAALAPIWWWWLSRQTDPFYQPEFATRGGLLALEIMALIIALILTPAVLAGSLAGEKERGSLPLLLTTRITAGEIVAGRMIGKLSQVVLILMACVPFLLLFASLSGLGLFGQATLLLLPLAVAWGTAGIASVASVVSKRGRNALISVYFFLVALFLLGNLLSETGLGRSMAGSAGLGASAGAVDSALGGRAPEVGAVLNPFYALDGLCLHGELGGAWAAIIAWTLFGIASFAIATWRLRPACLKYIGGEGGRKKGRRGVVPKTDEARPMLWKELYIERIGTLGWFGRLIGTLLIAWMVAGSLAFAGIILWHLFKRHDTATADWWIAAMGNWIGDPSAAVSWLIQIAIGLRAAVAVSSERERNTWDSLLTSPLEGGEIMRGKLFGSLYATRWLILSAFFAWTLCLAFGAMPPRDYIFTIARTIVVGAFIAAVGVRASLASPTATKSMSVTMGIWLGAWAGVAFVSVLAVAFGMLLLLLVWLVAQQAGLVSPTSRPWFPISFGMAWSITLLSIFASMTASIVAESRLRFDRIAGRIAGGELQVAFDRMIHGVPMGPVPESQLYANGDSKPTVLIDDSDAIESRSTG